MTTRTGVNDDGSVEHIINFEYESGERETCEDRYDYECDSIVVTHSPEDAQRMMCRCLDEEGDIAWHGAFETRDLAFAPISLLGRGESSTLLGIEPIEDRQPEMDGLTGYVPPQIRTVMQSLGMAVVPQGTWWLDT